MFYSVTFLLEIYPEEIFRDVHSFMYKDVHIIYNCEKWNQRKVQQYLLKVLYILYMVEYLIDILFIDLSFQRYSLQQSVKPILS